MKTSRLFSFPFIHSFLFIFALVLMGSSRVEAANRFSVATGNWNATSTWSATSGGASGASAPIAGDAVTIEGGFNVTVTVAAACASVTYTTSTATSLTINSGITLTVSGAITIPRSGSGVNLLAVGAGTLSAGSISFTSGGTSVRHQITISTGTVTVTGDVVATNTSASITFSGAGKLQLGGAFWTTGTLTPSTGMVEYTASAAQTVWGGTYNKLKLSGNNTKTLSAATTVSDSFIIGGSVTFSTGTNYTLTLNGNYVNSGTFTGNASTITIGGTTTTQNIANITTTGTVSVTKTAGTATLTANMTTGALTMNGTGGTLNLGAGLTDSVTGAVTLTNGTLNAGSSTLKVGGAWTGTATFTANTGTVSFSSAAAQTLPTTATTFNNLTLASANTKTLGSATTVSGTLTINSNVTLNTSGTSNFGLTLNGDFVKNGTFTGNASAITIGGTATQSIASFTTTGTVTVTKTGGTATLAGNMKAGALTMNGTGGTLNLGTALTDTITGAVTMTAGTLNAGSSTLRIGGNWTGTTATFTAGTSTVDYYAATAQTVGATNYNNLTISGARTTTSVTFASSGTIGVSGTFTESATFTSGGYILTGSTVDYNGTGAQTILAANYNNLTISGSRTINNVTLPSTGSVGIAGTFSSTATFTSGVYIYTGSTFDYNGTGAQTVAASTYNNLTISGARTTNSVTLEGGEIAIQGAFNSTATFTSGAYITTGSTIDYTGTGAQTITAFNYDNLAINGSHGANSVTFASSGTIGIGSSFTALASFTSGGYVITGSTVDYNGSGAATVTSFSYNNLTLSGAGTKTAGGAVTVAGDINISNNFSGGSYTHNISGNWTKSGTFTAGTSTINFSGSGAGNIGASNFNNVTFSGAGTKTATGILTIAGNVNITNNFTGGAFTHTVGGNWTNSGTFTSTGTTIDFNASTSGSIGTSSFNNVTFSGAGTKTATGALTISGNINITNNFTGGAFTHSVAGNWSNSGTFTATGTTIDFNGSGGGNVGASSFNNITFSGAGTKTATGVLSITGNVNISNNFTGGAFTHTVGGNWTNSGTFTSTGTTIDFSGAGSGNIGASSFNNITFSGAGTKTATGVLAITGNVNITGNFTAGSFTHTVTGNWANTGTFTSGSGTISFNAGSGTQTVNSGSSSFNNLIHTGAGTLQVSSSALNVAGNLTNSTGTLDANNGSINVGGNWSFVAPFTQGNGTVTFNGSTAQTIGGTTSVTFNNLTINNTSGGVSLASNETVTGTLTLSSGTFSVASSTLTLSGNPVSGTLSNFSTTSSSNVIFSGGSSGISIPTGATTLNKLTINNVNGVTLANNLTIGDTLKLTSGALSVGSNTLSLNGPNISFGSGTLSTSSSSSLSFGGSVSGVSIPSSATSLNNVTINNSNGISLNAGLAIAGTLTLSSGTFTVGSNTLTLNGQPISGTTSNLSVTSSSNISIGGSTTGMFLPSNVSALNDLTLNNTNGLTINAGIAIGGTLTLTNGNLYTGSNTIAANGSVTRTSGYVVGNMKKPVALGLPTVSFEIGDSTNYLPASISFVSVTSTGNLTAKVTTGDHPQISTSGINSGKSVNRYWTIANNGVGFISYGATLTFTSSVYDAGSNTNNFTLRKYDSGSWLTPTVTSRNSTNITTSGMNLFSDFAVGEQGTAVFSSTASSIAFGNIKVDSTRIDSVTITNTGTAPLNISTVASDNNQFSVTPTSVTLLQSGTQKFYITFAPTTSGAKSGNIVFTSDATSGLDTVKVTGTGTAPGFNFSPSNSISYGKVLIGSSKQDSITVSNTGTYDLNITSVVSSNGQFTATPTSASIAPSGTRKFYFTYTPTDTGTKVGNVVFTHNGTITHDTVAITGRGITLGFSASPTTISYGSIMRLTSKVDSVTVSNVGTSAFTINSVVSDNAQFSISPTSGTINASSSMKFYITFAPTDTGYDAGNVVFYHNGSTAPDSISVNGTSIILPLFSASSSTIAFNNVRVNTSKNNNLTITNTGTSKLHITSIVTNGQFSISPSIADSIGVSSNKVYTVTFSPTSTGAKTGTVVFTHDAGTSPDTIRLTGTGIFPTFSVAPTSISYGNVRINVTKTDTATVTNTGTDTLNISSVTSSDNVRYTISPTTAKIAPSSIKKFVISFVTSNTGIKNSTISFTHDASGSPNTISVSATGVSPTFSALKSSIDFGDVLQDSIKSDTITVNNTGTDTLHITSVNSSDNNFTVSPSSAVIPPSATVKFPTTFHPTTTGTLSGLVTFVHDATGGQTLITVSGKGITRGFTLSTRTVSFGTVRKNTSVQDSITVTNTGTTQLNISSLTSNNARFTVTPSSASIATSVSQKFYITFSPIAVASYAGNLIFVHDASATPDSVTLTGSGGEPLTAFSSTSIAYGNVLKNTTKTDSITITNSGALPLSISSVSSTNANFTVTPTSATVSASGGTQKFIITFSASSTGAKSGSILFTHNATSSPESVLVNGTGVAPTFTVSRTTVPFDSVVVGSTKKDSVTVTNTGTSTLTISNVTSGNADFTVTPTSGSIAPSATQKFYITFSATSTGARNANITFTHDDIYTTGSPTNVAVSGTGIQIIFTLLSSNPMVYGNIRKNTTKLDSIILENTGNAPMTVTSVTSNNAAFTVTPTSGTIAPLAIKKFFVTFAPVSIGSQTANILFGSNSGTSPDTVSVSGTGAEPLTSYSSTSIAYGNVLKNTTKTDSITITNNGGLPLSISSVSSTNASFSVTPSSASIAASGGTQKFYITFNASTTGAKSGSIIFTHNATSSPESVIVSATGVAPTFSITRTTVPFDSVAVGNTKTDSVTVTNTGTSTLTISNVTSGSTDFTVTPNSGSIAPSASQKFYITFSATSTGSHTSNITFTHDDIYTTGSPTNVSVSGTGIQVIYTLLSSNPMAYGNVRKNTTKLDSISIQNIGNAPMNITSVISNNVTFTVTPTTGSIAPLATKKFYVTFAPVTIGLQSAKIVFGSNSGTSPDTVSVNGTGAEPLTSYSSTSIAYGNVLKNTTKTDSITITNNGGLPLSISTVSSTNASFTVSPTSATVAASGGTQKFYITFNASTTGAKGGTILFTHNATSSPESVLVSGTGVAPTFSITRTTVAFDSVGVGGTKLDSVTVTNTGTSTLTISNVASGNGDFTVTPTSGSLAPSASQTYYITFHATTTGSKNGNITFTHDDIYTTGSPTNVAVSGTGIQVVFTITSSPAAYGNVRKNTTKRDSIAVKNTGNATMNVSSVTSSNAMFTITPTTGSIAPLATKQFYVTFAPTAIGAQTANIVFASNSGTSPDTVGVNGVGAEPLFSASPTSIAFGSVLKNTTKMDSITVTNNGGIADTVTLASSTDVNFTVSPTSGVIAAAGGTKKFYISFTPTSDGLKNGSIHFTHNATSSPDSITVNGTGISPGFSLSKTTLSFDSVNVGNTKTDSTVIVTNNGTSTLTISNVSSNNGNFSVSPTSGVLAPNGTLKFYLTFHPTATGVMNGNIAFTHDGTGSPANVSVSGVSVEPIFGLLTSSVDFGNVRKNTSKLDSFTVRNSGNARLTISSVTSSNGLFTVTPLSGIVNPLGGTKKFYVTYSPVAVGLQTASLVFNSNATTTPDTLPVSGVGAEPLYSSSKTVFNFGNVIKNTTTTDSLVVTNAGGLPLIISTSTSTDANFSITPTSVTIADSGGTQKFYVTFAPTSTGLKNAKIIFGHNAASTHDTLTVNGTGIASGFKITSDSLIFANTYKDSSKVDSLTVTNIGTANLVITNVASNNTADFAVSPNNATIAPSLSKVFYVTFHPSSIGARTGNIVYSYGTDSTKTVTVKGTGVAADFSLLSSNPVLFGNVLINSTKRDSIKIKNTGTAPLVVSSVVSDNASFTVTPASNVINPSASAFYYVTFAPTQNTSFSGNIIFVHNASSIPETVGVSGNGARPLFSGSTNTISFGSVPVTASKTDSVIVTNQGDYSLTVSSVSSNSGQFVITPTNAVIASGGGTQKFLITYTPSSSGALSAQINFVHNAAGSPFTLNVDGTGITSHFSTAQSTISLGNHRVGDNVIDTVTITNSGTATLNISSVYSDSNQFSVTPLSATIEPSASKQFFVTFAPTSTGLKKANIVFLSNSVTSPDTIKMSCTGVAPSFQSSISNLLFGDVLAGTTKLDSIVVSNTGTDTLRISLVGSDNGQYTVTPTDALVRPSDSTKFYVTFHPASIGPKLGNIVFNHNASTLPSKVTISGIGIAPIFVISDTSINFDTVGIKTSRTHIVTVSNQGTAPLNITSIVSSDTSIFFVTPKTLIVAPTSSQDISVRFKPKALGPKNAVIVFSYNQASSPTVITVSGVGSDTTAYRSFNADSIAIGINNKGKMGKEVKLKVDKSFFVFSLVTDKRNVDSLKLEYSTNVDTNQKTFYTIPASKKRLLTPNPKLHLVKRWTYTFNPPLDSGTTVYLYGSTLTKALQTVKTYQWSSNRVYGSVKKTGVTIVNRYLGFPEPNRINVLLECFSKGGFNSTGGMYLGINHTLDSASFYGWMHFTSAFSIQQTIGTTPQKLINGTPKGFDYFSKGGAFVGEKVLLFRTFYNNRLVSEMVAAKISIAASEIGITPQGFGDLIYNDSTDVLLNGKTIYQIVSMTDRALPGYYGKSKTDSTKIVHLFYDPTYYNHLDTVLHKINESFEGPIDTNGFATGLKIKGAKSLQNVPFLLPNPNAKNIHITPTFNSQTPNEYTLFQNFPNPFNPTTNIQFNLERPSIVSLKIYNLLGQEVATLLNNEETDEGLSNTQFDGSNLATGVYFYRLTGTEIASGKSFSQSKKLMLLK